MHIIVNGISVMLISIVAVITSVAAMSTVYGTSGKHVFSQDYVAVSNTDKSISCCIIWTFDLDAWGMESRWGKVFCTSPAQLWGSPCPLYNGYWDSFPGVKQVGCGIVQPPPSHAEVKVEEIYLYCPSGPLWPVTGLPPCNKLCGPVY
jgi:hypothetical protein